MPHLPQPHLTFAVLVHASGGHGLLEARHSLYAPPPPPLSPPSPSLWHRPAGAHAPPKHPVLYVRCDPGQEWLCRVTTLQPESMWVQQLERSRDVVAQSQAVAGGEGGRITTGWGLGGTLIRV